MTRAASANDAEEELVGSLCRIAGLPEPCTRLRLAGGRNNRVTRIDLADGSRAVMKHYHHDPTDGRDRLSAEWDFLTYAAARGLSEVPWPLARDVEANAGLYSFADGHQLVAGDVTAKYVAQALALVRRLNDEPRNPMRLAPASEACFSLAAHVATVERRLAQLDTIAPRSDLYRAACALVADRLRPAWEGVRARIAQSTERTKVAFDEPLAPEAICVSPSDFGFHNALINDVGRITFIDFEYAGRDDPAKLICDFFCQPEVPVPLTHFDVFNQGVMEALDLNEGHCVRARLLLDVCRVKWMCITLNDFLPTHAARREFADAGSHTERCRQQLTKATEALCVLGTG